MDVVMSRETATFRVPVSQATLPVTLFSTTGALAEEIRLAEPMAVTAAPQTPTLSPEDTLRTIGQDGWNVNELHASGDDDIAGLASIAGRLRPAVPRGLERGRRWLDRPKWGRFATVV